jgi:sugar phosphate isomerase/epimerase
MWPSIGLCGGTLRQASLPEFIEAAARHGFTSITVSPAMFADAIAAGLTGPRLLEQLKKAGVRVAMVEALTGGIPGAPNPDDLEPHLRRSYSFCVDDVIGFARALHAPVIGVAPFLGRPVPREEMARGITELAGRAAMHELTLALEFIPGTGIADAPEAAAIIKLSAAGNVGILLDIWHFVRGGGAIADIKTLPPEAFIGVQLCDRRASASGAPYVPMSGRSLPGEGDAPVARILRAVLANSPSASVNVEVFSDELASLTPDEAVCRTAAALTAFRNRYDAES